MRELSLQTQPPAGTLHDVPRRAAELFHELHRRDSVLSVVGWLHVGALLVSGTLFLLDDRTVNGESVWIKPMKFAVSIALYLWTLGWILHYLKPADSRHVAVLGRLVAVIMSLEFLLIFSQSARGVASHFNSASTYDVLVFRAMGVLILMNTVAVLYATALYFRRRPELPLPYLWGIRLGLALFLLTTVSGGIMIGIVSHSVGTGGDLRFAHFVSMHSLQALPLAGLLAYRLHERGRLRNPVRWTALAAVFMFSLHAAVLMLALSGRPLL